MKPAFTLITTVFLVTTVVAQTTRKVMADKIVGNVGDKIILRSDVYNDIDDRRRRGEPVPENADCFVMEQKLILKALVLQAEKDSLQIGSDEVDALLDNQIRGFIRAYGTKQALEDIAGRTVYQLKEDLRQLFTEMKLAERMQYKITENVRITPQEVKEYFIKKDQNNLPFYESQLVVGEIVVNPKTSHELEVLCHDEVSDFKKQAESGAQKFDILARLYSEDAESKDKGGYLAINRTEKNWGSSFLKDQAFINNAFRLKEGQISPVFKTKAGYHIIQMVSRDGDDAVIRHILRTPKITDAEVNEAVNKLDSAWAKLIAGTTTFGEAVARYSEDENTKYNGGYLQNPDGTAFMEITQLDKQLVELLAKTNIKAGEFTKPIAFTNESGKRAVRIVYLKTRTAPHRENLKDDYDQLAREALEVKKQKAMETWFATRLPKYYIMIDQDFRNCSTLKNWIQYTSPEYK